jgi:16S rRNA (cytosine1402-N4)-methyltransferase
MTIHVPVLAQEILLALRPAPGMCIVDGTLGGGGHTRLLAERVGDSGRIIALDRDPAAVLAAEQSLKGLPICVATASYADFPEVLDELAITAVDGLLLDLGLSSDQLGDAERGFSYSVDAPLDMRMDTGGERTAADLVNELDERELETIFRRYGEERYARQIARAIGRRRAERPYARTGELVDTIKCAIPAPARFGDGHPAKRVFQALRIAVNDELGALEEALPAAVEMLRPGGRLAVISFHSLEDRLVKRFLRAQEKGCTCPPDFPVCVCGNEPVLRALRRKAVRPGAAELAHTPRAASARLRVAEKAE